jgi:hypothetical protein
VDVILFAPAIRQAPRLTVFDRLSQKRVAASGGDLFRAPGLQFGFAQVRKSLREHPV